MIRVRMGLQHPLDRQLRFLRRSENGLHRTDVNGAVALIEIEHGIDDHGAAASPGSATR